MDQDKRMMRRALELAEGMLAKCVVPIACVFVDPQGQIIAEGVNATEWSSVHHAEIAAVSRLPDSQMPFTAYVTVEPCVMCASALAQTGCVRIVYGARNEKFGGCGGVVDIREASGGKFELEGGLFESEAVELLRRFFEVPNERVPDKRAKE